MNNIHINNGRNDIQELGAKLFVFILCPFASFLLSLKNAASRSSYVIYFLFAVIFAWNMDTIGFHSYNDLQGITERIRESHYTTNEIIDQIIAFITFAEDAPKELYMNFLIWVSKLFSENPHLTFAIAAIPWSYFFLKSLKFITTNPKFRNSNIICLTILMLFVLPRDVLTLQNPRFTTGVWMAIYACLQLHNSKERRWKYLILICCTPFIHSGFWPFVLLVPVSLFMKRFEKLTMVFFCASLPLSYSAYGIISNIDFTSLFLPDTLSRWITIYLSKDSYAKFVSNEGGSGFYWIDVLFNTLIQIVYTIVPFLLWSIKNTLKDIYVKQEIMFYVFLFAVINTVQFIPVLGERYFWIARILTVYIYFKYLYPKYKWWIWACLFACSWYIFQRYFYNGAVSISVPKDIFWAPSPYLIWKFLGIV